MKGTLSIDQNKSFDRIRNLKWYLPVLYYMTIVMCLLSLVLSMLRPMDTLPGKWAMYVGVDVIGMGICVAMFKGCLTGRDSNGDMTFLFAIIIFANGVLLFLDECSGIMQGLPKLRAMIIIVNIGIFIFIPLLMYSFWRYVRVVADLDFFLPKRLIMLLQILIVPLTIVCFVNLFFPFSFSVSEEGISNYEVGCVVTFAYALVAAVAILTGLRHSRISKSHKRVITLFFGVPLICSLFALPLFGATLCPA